MMSMLRFMTVAAVLMISALPVRGEVLLMDIIADEPPNSAEGVARPRPGMDMDAVRRDFGEPAQELAPVGDPPITRWVYDRFTVYFEYGKVIHTVVHPQADGQ